MCLLFLLFHVLSLCVSHTVRRRTVRKSEVREMPSLPRGGGDELVRDEQVSSRRVRPRSLPVGRGGNFLLFIQEGARPGLKARLPLQVEHKQLTVCACACARACLFPSQKQLEDYLNKLLRMAMYRKYHHTVSNRMTSAS